MLRQSEQTGLPGDTFWAQMGYFEKKKSNLQKETNNNQTLHLRWMIPPMVVHPEKIDFRRFV